MILMHTREARKQKTGTGRLAHLYLKNSKIIEGIDFTENSLVNSLIKDRSFFPAVLYPGESALDISSKKVPVSWIKNRKLLIFVIDGTWIAAKKMMRLSRNLHDLPRISVNPKEKSQFIIKQQPTDSCLSTIESLYYLIDELEKQGVENCGGRQQGLLDIQKRMCEYQLGIAADPSRGGYRRGRFRPPEERIPSPKWKKRSIFYK
jgi:DTW domain-containing protein YfiP